MTPDALVALRWMPKNSKPPMPGWYYTRFEKWVIARYYDDSMGGSWWNATARQGFTPNDSFSEWAAIPGVTDKQRN